MGSVTQYGRMTAHEGRGGEPAEVLPEAAEGPRGDSRGELDLVERQADHPDALWVTGMWRSRSDLDAPSARVRGSEAAAAAKALVESAR